MGRSLFHQYFVRVVDDIMQPEQGQGRNIGVEELEQGIYRTIITAVDKSRKYLLSMGAVPSEEMHIHARAYDSINPENPTILVSLLKRSA